MYRRKDVAAILQNIQSDFTIVVARRGHVSPDSANKAGHLSPHGSDMGRQMSPHGADKGRQMSPHGVDKAREMTPHCAVKSGEISPHSTDENDHLRDDLSLALLEVESTEQENTDLKEELARFEVHFSSSSFSVASVQCQQNSVAHIEFIYYVCRIRKTSAAASKEKDNLTQEILNLTEKVCL